MGRQKKAASSPLRRSSRHQHATESPASPVPGSLPPKRGRGRPRKLSTDGLRTDAKVRHDGTIRRSDASSVIVTPKRRGRPPKRSNHASATPKSTPNKQTPPTASSPAKSRGRLPQVVIQSTPKPVAIKPAEFGLEDVIGSFKVDCRAISADWVDGYSHEMTMNIHEPEDDGYALAAFDLGFVRGTMRIATSKSDLATWCGTGEETEETETPETPLPASPLGRKRALEAGNIRRPGSAKRAKVESMNSAHRFYFCWRGRSPIDSVSYNDDKTQSGWFDFPSSDGDGFWGMIDLPGIVGNGVWFHGVRCGSKPAAEPLQWDDFEHALTPVETEGNNSSQAPEAIMTANGDMEQPDVEQFEDGI